MVSRTVFLFPGLGAYSAGVLRQAHRDYPQVVRVFQEIDEVCGSNQLPLISDILFVGPPLSIQDMLERPAELLQLAIFGVSVAAHQILIDEGVRPYALVGHSFGEISALVAAGAFSVGDGARLVCARAEALRSWEGLGAMAAISTNDSVAGHLIGALDEPDLVIGCRNAPRQTVLSGPIAAIDRAKPVAEALNLFFTPLNLPYASHHPSMRGAVERFVDLTAGIRQQPLSLRVVSPIHGRPYTDDDDLLRRLGECLVLPVNFVDTVRDMHGHGVTTFIEVGALKALVRNAELTVPGIQAIAPLQDPDRETETFRDVATSRHDIPQPNLTAHAPGHNGQVPPSAVDSGHRSPPATAVSLAADRHAAGRAVVETQPTPASAPAPSARSRAELLERLRTLYAEALEYPADVLTEDALLESSLGVDSLKQTALLARVADEFQLKSGDAAPRMIDLPTLGHIADYVMTAAPKTAPR
jgi:[acyl-carrier-protein] S-malonyltransferase